MRVLCHCGKMLQVDDTLAGKTVRCAACMGLLIVPSQSVEREAEEEASRPVKRQRDYAEDDGPRPPRRKRKRKKKTPASSMALLWLLVGGAAVALATVLAVTLWPRGGAVPNRGASASANPGTPAPANPGTPVPTDPDTAAPANSDTPAANSPDTPVSANPGTPAPTEPGSPKPASSAAGMPVVLSDPKITVLDSQRMRASVKYRFAKGQPNAGLMYRVFVQVSYSAGKSGIIILGEHEGGTMKPEGVIEGEVMVRLPIAEGDTISYEFTMNSGGVGRGGGGQIKTISTPAKGSTGRSVGEGPRVALSDPRVTIVARDKLSASIKYRFVRGQPVAGTTYACLVFVSYGNRKAQEVGTLGKQDGAMMKSEGVLQTEFFLSQPIPEGGTVSYEFIMLSGILGQEGAGSTKKLSDPVRGSTR